MTALATLRSLPFRRGGLVVSREQFEIVFDGPALETHKMDVRDLAPALLALGDTIRRANQELNGDKATVNVYVRSGFEHGCFQVNLEVVQDLIEQLKNLLADDSVKSAKDILEWIGLVGGATFGTVIGFLRLRRGRQIKSVTQDTNKSGTDECSDRGRKKSRHYQSGRL